MFEFSFNAEYNEISKELKFSNSIEIIEVPIGALVIISVRVIINNLYVAQIISSNWIVSGNQIAPGNVIQTIDEGKGEIIYNRKLSGGYNGKPESILTGWVDNRLEHIIQVKGICEWNRQLIPFDVNGKIIVRKPIITTITDPDFVTPVKIDDESIVNKYFVQTSWNSGTLSYNCNQILIGGQIGFLQIVNGNRFRSGETNEIKGFKTIDGSIDVDNENNLFYIGERATLNGVLQTNDTPREELDWLKSKKFLTYKIGSKNDKVGLNSEYFITYLAYKAPLGNGIVASYIVVERFTEWFWNARVVKDDTETWKLSYSNDKNTKWIGDNGWSLPLWKNNSINGNVWRIGNI